MLNLIKKFFKTELNTLSNPDLWKVISSAPLVADGTTSDSTITNRIIKKTKWTRGRTEAVIREYRRFLYLAAISKQVVPSSDVDEVWHEHILFTYDYFSRWTEILGKTLHHQPEIEGKKNSYSSGYVETRNSYQKEFGTDNDFYIFWPLIVSDKSETAKKEVLKSLEDVAGSFAENTESYSNSLPIPIPIVVDYTPPAPSYGSSSCGGGGDY